MGLTRLHCFRSTRIVWQRNARRTMCCIRECAVIITCLMVTEGGFQISLCSSESNQRSGLISRLISVG